MFIFLISYLSCKNILNQNVEWFSIFKIPSISSSNPFHSEGVGYFYHDKYHRLNESYGYINETYHNPIYYTLLPLYSNNKDLGYFLFSDQPPEGSASSTFAHMKGLVIFDQENAIVIEHSVPLFPPSPINYTNFSYPQSGKKYGQSFLCLSIKTNELDFIAEGLLISRPFIYSFNLPSYSSIKLNKLINKEWDNINLTSTHLMKTNSDNFLFFSKSKDWNNDIYHDLIAKELKTNLIVETWCLGPTTNNMPSNCSDYHVYNSDILNFNGIKWTRTKDHSKYAIGGDIVCITGTNRQYSQIKRGGGAFCVKDYSFSKILIDVMEKIHYCNE